LLVKSLAALQRGCVGGSRDGAGNIREKKLGFGKRIRRLLNLAAIGSAAVVAACGGGGTGAVVEQPMGTLRFALTDAPACGFDEVNITVSRIRVHQSQNADDSASGWRDHNLTPPRRINLIDLQNGVLEELGQMALPAGQYTQLRLLLDANAPANNNTANSVLPVGVSEQQPLDTPSGTQSGIKLINSFTVPAGGLVDLLLDFDACKSIVTRGNGSFGLKPVITFVPRVVAEIVGNVDPSIAGVRISAQAGGAVMRSTVPDANGAFKLAFLNPAVAANVDVVFAAPGRTTSVISAVPIAVQSITRVSTATVPLTLSFAVNRNASGNVAPAAALPSVRAVQKVGTVPQVEIASVNANDAGVYVLTLPAGPPSLAPYSATLPLVFIPQVTDAGLYTLEASAPGFVTQSNAIDLTTANATVDFTLPPAP
jgi:hypothetical protein